MKRTPQNSQIPYVRRSGQVVLCAHRVASFPNKPITSGPSLGCSERDLEWVPPGGGYTLMASHFLSAALRASATSRQHPSPQRQNTFVTLFYRQEKGTKGSPARNVNSPAACFWRIISAALSLSRCISEPVLSCPSSVDGGKSAAVSQARHDPSLVGGGEDTLAFQRINSLHPKFRLRDVFRETGHSGRDAWSPIIHSKGEGRRGSAYHGSLLLQVGLTGLVPLIPARHLKNSAKRSTDTGSDLAADSIQGRRKAKRRLTGGHRGRGGEFGIEVWEWSHLGRLIGF